MREVGRYYEEGGRMPNPLLVNIREGEFDLVRVEFLYGTREDYERAIRDGTNWIGAGFIEFPKSLRLWIYDGQHREGGLVDLLERDEAFSDFPVPLSIFLGMSELEEMTEFYQVNTNAKSVKTDLAWELLRQMALQDPQLAYQLNIKGRDWITRGIDVARALDGMGGPWFDRIQAPNEKKKRSDQLMMAEAQFVQSLKPVLDMALFNRADPQTIAQVLNAYWQGIAKVLPEPFAQDTSPKDWVVQKGPGASALHRALPGVIEVIRARGRRLGDADAYAQAMARLVELTGEITNEDSGQRVQVSGSDFWRAGGKGVAGAYSGEAGRRHLFLMLQALLPKPAEEIAL
jgi:DGQHR domain-containing protein